MRIFHFTWSSYEWADVISLGLGNPTHPLNGPDCFGLYYITGSHFVYGQETMLYLGKAQEQRFGYRLNQHEDFNTTNVPSIKKVYVGKLLAWDAATKETWGETIGLSETLFINSHLPAMNATGVKWVVDEKTFGDILICNWNDLGFVLPEISGARFSGKYWNSGLCHKPC